MTWLRTTPEDAATGDVAAAYARDREDVGYVSNDTRVFADRLAVRDAWEALIGAITASMDPRRYELATLAAALRLRSSYCSLAHGQVLAERFEGSAGVVPSPPIRRRHLSVPSTGRSWRSPTRWPPERPA
jgi:hypothetical protein